MIKGNPSIAFFLRQYYLQPDLRLEDQRVINCWWECFARANIRHADTVLIPINHIEHTLIHVRWIQTGISPVNGNAPGQWRGGEVEPAKITQ